MTSLAILNEAVNGETRVCLTPDVLKRLDRRGISVSIEAGAGVKAGYPDEAYAQAGARECPDRAQALGDAQLVACIGAPSEETLTSAGSSAIVLGMYHALTNPDLVNQCAAAGITAMSYDLVPRISRAQSVDVLSAMASLAGYKAVLLGASHLTRLLPMMMTAAGTMRASKVFIIGAGVAGLQAIATAKRLGAIVDAYDLRPTVKEQIESLGAKFVEFDVAKTEGQGGYAGAQSVAEQESQRQQMGAVVAESQLVITTAAVPGKAAPKLIDESMVQAMEPGSVIVDLAAQSGGNCTLTTPGEITTVNGVTIIGLTDLATTMPYHASQMLGRIVVGLVEMVVDKEGAVSVPLDDDIVGGMTVTHGGEIVSARVREAMGLPEAAKVEQTQGAAT